jgi:hypothetical protein
MTRRRLITRAAIAAAVAASLTGIALGTAASTNPPPSLVATAGRAPGRRSGGPVAAAVSAPGPHVQPFALAPRGAVHAPLASPATPVAQPITVDGCDHDYGTPNQCVPVTYPAGVGNRCAWLIAHGFGPMKIIGTDTERLDIDHNRIACDPGDL